MHRLRNGKLSSGDVYSRVAYFCAGGDFAVWMNFTGNQAHDPDELLHWQMVGENSDKTIHIISESQLFSQRSYRVFQNRISLNNSGILLVQLWKQGQSNRTNPARYASTS